MGKLCDICIKNLRSTGEQYCICSYRGKTKKRDDTCSKFVGKINKPKRNVKYDALAWIGGQ